MEEPTRKEVAKIMDAICVWHEGIQGWETAKFLAKLVKRIEKLEALHEIEQE